MRPAAWHDGFRPAAVEVRDDDPRSLTREPLRGGAPKARGAAGHERDLPLEAPPDRDRIAGHQGARFVIRVARGGHWSVASASA